MLARLFGNRREPPEPEVRRASQAFRDTVTLVGQAKDALLTAVPANRGSVVPLAEALAAFEAGLAAASASMAGWRASAVEDTWVACRVALEEATRRAEALRLGEAPEAYEHAYGPLAELLEPLDAFGAAAERFRRLGV